MWQIVIPIAAVVLLVACLLGVRFLRPRLRCPVPSNCLVCSIKDHGLGVVVPLMLRNVGLTSIAIARFSLELRPKSSWVYRTHELQVGVQWFTALQLSENAEFDLGAPLAIRGLATTTIIVAFVNKSQWCFYEGPSQATVRAYDEKDTTGRKLCSFTVNLNAAELKKLAENRPMSFYQRWVGHDASHNVLIPHERTAKKREE